MSWWVWDRDMNHASKGDGGRYMPCASMLWKKRVNCCRSFLAGGGHVGDFIHAEEKRQHAASSGDVCIHVFFALVR